MIGKKTLKLYEFMTIEDYFKYIIDSYINGNFSQVRELFNKLSDSQKNIFLMFLHESNFNERLNLLGFLLKP